MTSPLAREDRLWLDSAVIQDDIRKGIWKSLRRDYIKDGKVQVLSDREIFHLNLRLLSKSIRIHDNKLSLFSEGIDSSYVKLVCAGAQGKLDRSITKFLDVFFGNTSVNPLLNKVPGASSSALSKDESSEDTGLDLKKSTGSIQ